VNGVYQQIFTFLLQIQRTKYLLDHISSISQHRERRKLKGDIHIIHALRLELIWFVNTLLNYLGFVVCTLRIVVDVGYSTHDNHDEGQITRMPRCGGVGLYSCPICLVITISMSTE
jgi:Gamma tubulin complex component C-terminal